MNNSVFLVLLDLKMGSTIQTYMLSQKKDGRIEKYIVQFCNPIAIVWQQTTDIHFCQNRQNWFTPYWYVMMMGGQNVGPLGHPCFLGAGPLWAYCDILCHFGALLVTLGRFGSLWQFGPLRPKVDQSCPNSRSGQKWINGHKVAQTAKMGQSSPKWTKQLSGPKRPKVAQTARAA